MTPSAAQPCVLGRRSPVELGRLRPQAAAPPGSYRPGPAPAEGVLPELNPQAAVRRRWGCIPAGLDHPLTSRAGRRRGWSLNVSCVVWASTFVQASPQSCTRDQLSQTFLSVRCAQLCAGHEIAVRSRIDSQRFAPTQPAIARTRHANRLRTDDNA